MTLTKKKFSLFNFHFFRIYIYHPFLFFFNFFRYPLGSLSLLIKVTSNNIFTLYDLAILGIVKHSRAPLRFMTLLGFISSLICLVVAFVYFILKVLFWDSFTFGSAPTILGLFTVSSIQIILLGLLGEYIGIILLHQRNMPLVIEKERINFD